VAGPRGGVRRGLAPVLDPQLTSDGHVAAGSPAVDAVAATPGVVYDIDGAMRGGQFDVGADEL
jgi:hypothetical protein